MIHIRYVQNYIGDRRYPLDSLKHKSDHVRRREMRNELYIKYKKFREIERRKRIISEYRKKRNKDDKS